MRSIHRIGSFAACLLGTSLCLVACDNTAVTPFGFDSGRTDAGADMMTIDNDASVPTDSGPRMDASDMFVPFDSGVFDAGPAPDMGLDTGIDRSVVLVYLRETFCAPVASALCDAYSHCGCDAAGSIDHDVCVSEQTGKCVDWAYDYAFMIARGIVVFNEELLETCVNELRALPSTCSAATPKFASTCQLAFAETKPLGAICDTGTFSVGCASGEGYCDESTSFSCVEIPSAGESCTTTCASPYICRAGVCAERSASGGTCASQIECTPGLLCLDGSCREVSDVGEACDATHPCVTGSECRSAVCVATRPACEDDSACAPETICRGVDAYLCRAPVGVGSHCESDEGCVIGAVCNYESYTCIEAPHDGDSCEWNSCGDGHYCDYESSPATCHVLPGNGEPCAGGGFVIGFDEARPAGGRPIRGSRCAEGLICHYFDDGSSPICVPPPTYGEECWDGACSEGYSCVYMDSGPPICGLPPAPGERCSGGDCPYGYFCQYDDLVGDSLCVAQRVAGELCDYSEMCAPGTSCVFDGSRYGTCLATPGFGEMCPSGECVEGAFCAYTLSDASCVSTFCDDFSTVGPPIPLAFGASSTPRASSGRGAH